MKKSDELELRILDAQKKVRAILDNAELTEEDRAKQSEDAAKELNHLRTKKAAAIKSEGDEARAAQKEKGSIATKVHDAT